MRLLEPNELKGYRIGMKLAPAKLLAVIELADIKFDAIQEITSAYWRDVPYAESLVPDTIAARQERLLQALNGLHQAAFVRGI
jgi:hypothetical protein